MSEALVLQYEFDWAGLPHTGSGRGAGAAQATTAAVRAAVMDSFMVAKISDADLLYGEL